MPHLARLGKIEVHLLGEGKGVGHAHHARGKRHLVGELCSLALARAAKAVNLGGERLEDVADGLDALIRCADDQREGTGDSTGIAAGHRAVEGMLAVGLGGLSDITSELGSARGEVDKVSAGLGGSQQAVAGKIDLLNVCRITHHGEDDIGVLGSSGGAIGPHGTARHKVIGLGLGAVVDGDGIAGIQDVAGDGRAHDARSDECDRQLLVRHAGTP